MKCTELTPFTLKPPRCYSIVQLGCNNGSNFCYVRIYYCKWKQINQFRSTLNEAIAISLITLFLASVQTNQGVFARLVEYSDDVSVQLVIPHRSTGCLVLLVFCSPSKTTGINLDKLWLPLPLSYIISPEGKRTERKIWRGMEGLKNLWLFQLQLQMKRWDIRVCSSTSACMHIYSVCKSINFYFVCEWCLSHLEKKRNIRGKS